MGVLLAFLAGWAAGARSGHPGFADVTDAVAAVRRSEEFRSLVAVTTRHAAAALRGLGGLVAGSREEPSPSPADLLARVQRLSGGRAP